MSFAELVAGKAVADDGGVELLAPDDGPTVGLVDVCWGAQADVGGGVTDEDGEGVAVEDGQLEVAGS